MAVVNLTQAQIDSGLHSPFKLGPAQFTYSLPGAGSTWETGGGNYSGPNQQPFQTYSTLDAAQADAFRAAIADWDSLILPNFTEVQDNASLHGEVRIAFTSNQMPSGVAGYAYQGSNQTPTSIVGDIWLNSSSAGESFAYGSNNYQTIVHELGHVLGLKHSFQAPEIPDPYDTTRYTVMAYADAAQLVTFGGGGNSITSSSGPVAVATPMVLDIKAVQDLYGADPNTRTGNTTYTFNQADSFLQSIYDAGGTDTLDFSTIARPNVIDLAPGSYSSVALFSVADQQAYWQQFYNPGLYGFIAIQLNQPDTYTWSDNLGIAFGTTIENVIGGSGNDTITGNDADNLFYLQHGGTDSVGGGNGRDGFYFGQALTVSDIADGGLGVDSVAIQGDYSSLTLGNVQNVEALVLVSGSNATFGDTANNRYDYNITLRNANVAAAQTFTIQGKDLLAGEDLFLNGAAEADGKLQVFAGRGNDGLTGGGANDGFFFGADGNYTAADVVHGGAGLDSIALRGNYSGAQAVTFANAGMSGIEALVTLSGHTNEYGGPIVAGGFDYDLTTANGNVTPGQQLQVIASTLGPDESLRFDGRAELDGSFRILAGAGDDTLFGGSNNDILYGGLGVDQLTGGGGGDRFLYRSTLESTSVAPDTLLGFDPTDVIDLSFIDAIAGTPASDAFNFIGSTAFSDNAVGGELRAAEAGGDWVIEADTNGDGLADWSLLITGTIVEPITAGDFIL